MITLVKSLFADALSFLRSLCALVGGLLIVFHLNPIVALILILVAAFTEPLDGYFARLWDLQRRWFPLAKGDDKGKAANEMATGAFCGLIPGAILLRAWLDSWRHWSVKDLAFPVVWTIACVVFILGTIAFAKGRAQLIAPKAERAEVHQAWFTGVIYIACAYAVGVPLWVQNGDNIVFDPEWWLNAVPFTFIVFFAASFVGIAAGDRLNHRHVERDNGYYKAGTKVSWKQVNFFGK